MSNEATLSALAEQELHIPCSSRGASISSTGGISPLPRQSRQPAATNCSPGLSAGPQPRGHLHLPTTWRTFAMANQQPAYRALSVIKREGQDDYWLAITMWDSRAVFIRRAPRDCGVRWRPCLERRLRDSPYVRI